MKRNLTISMLLTATAFVGVVALAQNPSAENQALSKALQGQAQDVQNQPQIEVVNDPVTAPVQAQTNTQTTTVQNPVILQNRPTNTIQQPTLVIQKQPTTVVEDSPLSESAADRLRKQRVEIEQQTESRIVEKLEQERIKAEQDRANKLMGALEEKKEEQKKDDKADAAATAAQPVVVAPIVQQPVVQQVEQAPAPAIESKAELKDLDKEEKKSTRMYIGGDAGFVVYPSADNVRVSPGIGFSIGTRFDEKFILEGSFLYSRGDIENANGIYGYNGYFYPDMETMNQYGVASTFKYRILDSKFSPVVGATLSYTYRDYQAKQCVTQPCIMLEGTSWAIDAGLIAGADLKLTDNLSVGADLKYMFNVTYDVTTKNGQLEPSLIMYQGMNGDPIESIGYYSFLLHATLSF